MAHPKKQKLSPRATTTHNKCTEESNASLQQYKILLDSIDEGFCIIQMIFDEHDNPVDYRFLKINPAFEKQTKIKDVLGKSIYEIFPNYERSRLDMYGKIALTGESAHFETHAEWLHRWYEVHAARFGMPEKRQVAVLFNDISMRKQAEKQILQKAHALALSNQALDEFAYAASHDLKAPLRVIDNASKWLEEDLQEHLTDETRATMDLLRKRIKRMEKLLDDLLEYSRIGRIQDESFVEKIAGNDLIANILELLSPPKNFTVTIDPYFSKIHIHKMPLQQILMNLIGNAIKHHDKKEGHIDITVKENDHYYSFSVKDDGPGIAAQYHEKIFKIFQTLKSRDQVEGSGMGLAIVKKHLDTVGGSIYLESAEGKGSTFSFTWPKL